LIIFFTDNPNAVNLKVWADDTGVGAQFTALIAFLALIAYFVWESFRAKKED